MGMAEGAKAQLTGHSRKLSRRATRLPVTYQQDLPPSMRKTNGRPRAKLRLPPASVTRR